MNSNSTPILDTKHFCENCRYFRIAVTIPNNANENGKWELKACCINTERYGRDLRLRKKIESYNAYRDEAKKPISRTEYLKNVLSNKERYFENVNPPVWCNGYKED